MENNKFIPNTQKTYEVAYMEQKQSKLSPTARSRIINKSSSNYQSERATINNPSYGPGIDSPGVKKYCSKCKADKEVESGDNYCPTCGKSFNVNEASLSEAVSTAHNEGKIDSEVAQEIASKIEKEKEKW